VAGGDGTLVRAEAASGRQLWRVKAGTDLTAGVGTDGNVIVVGGAKGAAGLRHGRQAAVEDPAVERILSSPVVGQGIVVARSVDNRIVGIDAATGQKKWTVQRAAPALTLRPRRAWSCTTRT
jgi:outer membrane protein assembly factor BamB